ncbi:hypothetical protein [Streptomyces sp. NPDC088757]|uniref:hypothetical protein n=1 Tax=Streptomyces sp. NPDC088757 TaxID=3365889 RepID=UPI0037F4E566
MPEREGAPALKRVSTVVAALAAGYLPGRVRPWRRLLLHGQRKKELEAVFLDGLQFA